MGIPSIDFQVAGLAFSAISAFSQSSSQKNAYKYQEQVAANNAKVAKWQAEDARRRGDEAAADQHRKMLALGGNQAATLASRGFDLNSGSAWNTLSDTQLFGGIDEERIRDNAKKQAWSFEVQANNDMANSQAYGNASDNINPMMAAGGTLLTGAGSVADSWYKLNPSTTSSTKTATSLAEPPAFQSSAFWRGTK